MSIYKVFISVAIKDGIIVGRMGSVDTEFVLCETLLMGWLTANGYIHNSNTLQPPTKAFDTTLVVGLMSAVDISSDCYNVVKATILVNLEEIEIVS